MEKQIKGSNAENNKCCKYCQAIAERVTELENKRKTPPKDGNKKPPRMTLNKLAEIVMTGFANVNSRLDVLEQDVSTLKEKVSNLETQVQRIDKEVQKLNKEVQKLNKEVFKK